MISGSPYCLQLRHSEPHFKVDDARHSQSPQHPESHGSHRASPTHKKSSTSQSFLLSFLYLDNSKILHPPSLSSFLILYSHHSSLISFIDIDSLSRCLLKLLHTSRRSCAAVAAPARQKSPPPHRIPIPPDTSRHGACPGETRVLHRNLFLYRNPRLSTGA
jgi:hypothetical protein